MNYGYTLKNIDLNQAFLKRSIIYVAILMVTVSIALTILFLLFQLYLWLILSGGLLIVALAMIFLIGRLTSLYSYQFLHDTLVITTGGGKEQRFVLSELSVIRNAEKSDFSSKEIVKYAFLNGVIITKNAVNQNTQTCKSVVVNYQNKDYLLTFDDYSYSNVLEVKDEDTIL